ncbi:MAG: DUF4258 domain-containing protein [Nitrospirota bacterium]
MKPSRHARNNMRLYDISEKEIIDAIRSPDYIEKIGIKVTVHKIFPNRFSGFPLKVVYEEKDEIFIITAYPLKKTYRR